MVLYDICKDFVMTEKIEKSVRHFVPHESDKEFKRRYQALPPRNGRGGVMTSWTLMTPRGMSRTVHRRMSGCGTVSLWIEFIIPK